MKVDPHNHALATEFVIQSTDEFHFELIHGEEGMRI